MELSFGERFPFRCCVWGTYNDEACICAADSTLCICSYRIIITFLFSCNFLFNLYIGISQYFQVFFQLLKFVSIQTSPYGIGYIINIEIASVSSFFWGFPSETYMHVAINCFGCHILDRF